MLKMKKEQKVHFWSRTKRRNIHACAECSCRSVSHLIALSDLIIDAEKIIIISLTLSFLLLEIYSC